MIRNMECKGEAQKHLHACLLQRVHVRAKIHTKTVQMRLAPKVTTQQPHIRTPRRYIPDTSIAAHITDTCSGSSGAHIRNLGPRGPTPTHDGIHSTPRQCQLDTSDYRIVTNTAMHVTVCCESRIAAYAPQHQHTTISYGGHTNTSASLQPRAATTLNTLPLPRLNRSSQ